jgi:hypothetical protein
MSTPSSKIPLPLTSCTSATCAPGAFWPASALVNVSVVLLVALSPSVPVSSSSRSMGASSEAGGASRSTTTVRSAVTGDTFPDAPTMRTW